MHFDWTINAGSVIAGVALLVAFVTAHVQNRSSIQDMQTKVDLIYEWFKKRVILRGEE